MVATSHTPNTRPSRSVARGLRGRVRAHLLTDSRAGAFGRPSWVSGVRVGLVVLVGLTAWAVASISVWMVPAYLALMVLIFVMPQGRRPSKPASEPGTEPIRFGVFAIDKSLRVDRAAGSDHIRSVDEPLDSGLEADEAAIELSGSVPDSAGSEAVKPRRGRGRARKSAKAVAELAPDSAVATWIRVGPGKFVRADSINQAVDPAGVEEFGVETVPATDAPPAPATSAPAPPAALLAEQDPLDSLETTPGDGAMIVSSDDGVLGSVTEEYGITPSAFGPAREVSPSAEDPGQDLSGVVAQPEDELASLTSLDVKTSWLGEDAERPRWRRQTFRGRSVRVSRGIASAIVGVDPASSRRHVRTPPRPRTLVWSPFAPNARVQQAARRAFGRINHVQRALRARSPPSRS